MRTLCLLLALVPALLFAQTTPWTVDDALNQERISQVSIAPDGQRVAWIKSSPDKEKDRFTSDLYLSLLPDSGSDSDPEILQLTRTGNNRSPLWSPSGHRLAFLSSRKNPDAKNASGQQIWLLDPRGGAPQPLTTMPAGVRGFEWKSDSTIVFTGREKKTAYETYLEGRKDDVLVVEDTTLFFPVRLFSVEVHGKKVRRLTDNQLRIGSFAVSPTGQHAVYTLNRSPITADARVQPTQHLLNLETSETVEIFEGQYFDPSGFDWTLDGSGFYASDEFSSDPENEGAGITELYYFDVASMSHEKVPLDWDWGVGYGYAVSKNGIHVQLANGTTFLPRYYEKTSDGWRHVDATDVRLRHSTSVTIGPDGETMVFDYSRPDVPPTYNYGKYLEGHVAQEGEVAKLNGYLKKRTPLRAEVIQWEGAEQDSVNGILYYPSDYQEGRRYPLVTVIHGGPSGVDLDAWRLSWTVFPGLLADRGAFVFRPNYHGSGNHGLEWVESIKGRYYELEVPDIVMGIEHLAEQGLIDQDSLAVMGWSNGAILTTALTVEHPEMFKVAAPGAGDVNWISDYGNCAFGVSFDNSYFRGAPWDHLDHYIEKSPLFRMPEVITPTLIHHGDRDTAVPTEQGWQYYRALQQIGKAPVRYLLYPGQPHGLQRISHQRRKVEEDLAWIDQYLFGKGSMEETVIDRALPESSPLALLVKKTQPAQVDGRYGVRIRGALAPETVALNDSLNVGRFEVTRAQFREFDKRYRVPAGTENYPANNISFERAEAYVEWLSKKTRRSYRLPTKAELGQLKAAAGSSENTLAHWTGSNPTPDELALLQQTLSSVSADDLLMAVGSRPAGNSASKTKPLVFDTNGNVAEWSAEGKATNGYAAGSADTYAEANDPPLRFTGLRVVGG